MSDVTFGVKVPEELKDQINDMMKASGLVGREFMQQLVDSYIMEQDKVNIPEMAEEIKELQLLTHRINEIYMHIGARFQNIIDIKEKEKVKIETEIAKKQDAYEDEKKKYIMMIDNQKRQLSQLEEKHKEITSVNENLKKEIEKANDYNESYKELGKQYKDKIVELEEELENLKQYKEENEQLRESNKVLQEQNDNLASELWFGKREIEKLNEQISKVKKEYEGNLSYINEQHSLEKKTIHLNLQLENQKNIESLNQKIVTIQEEYNEKLKEMLLQINRSNNTEKTGRD